MRYRTGLNRSPPEAHAANLFARGVALPTAPPVFRSNLFPAGCGMLGNDRYGDCGIAGPMHAEMWWPALAKQKVPRFTAADAEDDYFVLAPLDTGTNLVQVGDYWQATGLRDAIPVRHKIVRYASIQGSEVSKPNAAHVDLAAYLFGCCGIGIDLPNSVDTQFDKAERWSVVPGASDSGEYHFVLVVTKGDGFRGILTWGQYVEMGDDFFDAYCREAMAYLKDPNDPNAALFGEL